LKYLLADHLGSTTLSTDANGTVQAAAMYKAFGELRSTPSSLGTDYKFTGQREEASLGLYFFVSRWFDPSLGRFTSPDSIVPTSTQGTQAWDRYAFVNNNPVRYRDPTGHQSTDTGDNPNGGCGGAGQHSCGGISLHANESDPDENTEENTRRRHGNKSTYTEVPQSCRIGSGTATVSYCINGHYETIQIASGDGYRTITFDLNNVDPATQALIDQYELVANSYVSNDTAAKAYMAAGIALVATIAAGAWIPAIGWGAAVTAAIALVPVMALEGYHAGQRSNDFDQAALIFDQLAYYGTGYVVASDQ